jgi:signal peptide peptidase SppA
MRFEHLIRIVETEPWLIRPSSHAAIRRILSAHIDGTAHRSDGIADLFEKQDPPKMTIENGVGIIPIRGIIGKGVSAIEKSSGVVDTDDIVDMLDQADADESVASVLLDIDSPGGTVTGVPETAERVRSMTKPTLAYTGGQMDSAAYWIGSAADTVYASQSAAVGSVGVYMAIMDTSANYAMQGVSVDLIKNGTFKGAGMPGTSLTPEQREEFQRQIDYIAAEFKASVLKKRTKAQAYAMEGQEMYGPQALEAGLIDGVTDFYTALKDATYMSMRKKG